MPASHSSFLHSYPDAPCMGNLAVLPVRNTAKTRSIAPVTQDQDIVDEALYVYRANCFFKQFEIQGPADRTLIYLLFAIHEFLSKLTLKTSKDEALRTLYNQSNMFIAPGEPGFPLSILFTGPPKAQQEQFKAYLLQLRMELATRLVNMVYSNPNDPNLPSKWWLAFSRRKFMNKSLI